MDLIKNDIKKLKISLRKKSAFQLCIAVFNNPIDRKQIIEKSTEIKTLKIEDNIIEFEKKLEKFSKNYKTIHIIGLENLKNLNYFIKHLNLHRDYIAKIAEVNLVFWVLESQLKKFISNAQDLFHWSSGLFNFISNTNYIDNIEEQIQISKKINIEKITITPNKDLPKNFLGHFNIKKIWYRLKKKESKYLEPIINFLIKKLYENINIYNKDFYDIKDLKYLKYATIILEFIKYNEVEYSLNIIKLYQISSLSYLYLKDLQNAKSYIEKSINIIDSKHPKDNQKLSKSYNILSNILLELGDDIKKSKEYQEKAIFLIKNYKNSNYYLSRYYLELAKIYKKLNNIEKEKFYIKKSLKLFEHIHNNPKDLSNIYYNLAKTYNTLGDLQNAKFYIEKSINIKKGDHINKLKDLDYLLNIKKIIDKKIEDSLIKIE
jgi:tetratricopeptide (TPR) repeat protein